ncbi:MAG: ATP-binding protein [Treponema sp.]|nr:ATP-binding protein [Treponema sp.]
MALIIVRLLIFASITLTVYMFVVTIERCRSEKRYKFIYCLAFIFFYNLGYLLEISSGSVGGGIIATKIEYLGGTFMTPFFFFFVAEYCEIRLPKKYYFLPILIVPILFYLVVATFEYHQLLYLEYNYDVNHPILGLYIVPGRLYLVGTFYPLFCIALTLIVIIRSMVKQNRTQRLALILLLISALAPLIANFSYVALSYFFESAFAGILFTPFVMVISNFIIFYNIIMNDMFDLAPKAHAITMDLIRDAFVVLDRGMAYTGSNKTAHELFPALGEIQKGASIQGLENWPEELLTGLHAEKSGGPGESELRREIEFTLPHRPGKIYSGWENRVTSESGGTLGFVILIQDITETISLIQNIQAQRDEIAAMRDNLKEGLFLMDREYKIQPSYSKAMEDVLSTRQLQGKSFTALLKKSFSAKELGIIGDYFTMIMDKSIDAEMLEDMNPLAEFTYISTETNFSKTLRCLFAPVDQGGGEIFVMGTIQDISAETLLKKQLAEEEARQQNEMRNLFEVMQVDQDVFADFIEDTDDEFGRINALLKNKKIKNRELLIKLYQLVHAVKSNAVIVGLSAYGEKLHELETIIKKLREKETEIQFDEILHITVELEKLQKEKEKLEDILKRIRDFNSSAKNENKKEEDVFIDALKQICKRVAADENKKAALTVETFDKKTLIHDQKRAIKEILTQLVRNAVYHGIETPEERLALGKSEEGKITLNVKTENGRVRIILADDGNGLNFDAIAQKALALGLLKNPEADKTNKQLLSNLIFSTGFSTSEKEDLHGGRGIGLNLVRDSLKEIQGTIQLNSKKGHGLTFDITIPF